MTTTVDGITAVAQPDEPDFGLDHGPQFRAYQARVAISDAFASLMEHVSPSTVRQMPARELLAAAAWLSDGAAGDLESGPQAAKLVAAECSRRESQCRKQARMLGQAYRAFVA